MQWLEGFAKRCSAKIGLSQFQAPSQGLDVSHYSVGGSLTELDRIRPKQSSPAPPGGKHDWRRFFESSEKGLLFLENVNDSKT